MASIFPSALVEHLNSLDWVKVAGGVLEVDIVSNPVHVEGPCPAAVGQSGRPEHGEKAV